MTFQVGVRIRRKTTEKQREIYGNYLEIKSFMAVYTLEEVGRVVVV